MDTNLYAQFEDLKNVGRREEAKICLDQFIASFDSSGEILIWVHDFLKSGNHGHKIRHEIYEKLIYPTLLRGYLLGDSQSTIWLARTSSNLHDLKQLHPSLLDKSEFVLLREAYEVQPDALVGRELLKSLISNFDYAQHEWPWGILRGHDGASLEECSDILDEIEFARQLDSDDSHRQYLDDFEHKVREYLAGFKSLS